LASTSGRGSEGRHWTSTDLVGVEECAAAKNCYALGTGFMSEPEN